MYPISVYVLLEAQDSMLQWQVLRSGIASWVRVHASACGLIIMQLRTIVALRARVQRSMHPAHRLWVNWIKPTQYQWQKLSSPTVPGAIAPAYGAHQR